MRPFEVISEPMAEERKRLLRQWLAKPEGAMLHLVIAAKARMAEQEAISQAHQISKTAESQDRALLAGGLLMKAQRYHQAAEVLEEIQSDSDNWYTIKLVH